MKHQPTSLVMSVDGSSDEDSYSTGIGLGRV